MAETTETTQEKSPTAQAAPLPSSERDLRRTPAPAANPRLRLYLIIGAVVLVVVGVLLWLHLSSYESTDDAQIDGHLNPISARVAGHVTKLLVNDNQYVDAGTPLIQIDPADYQVALENAKAQYEDAVAAARAAQANVPITTISTGSQISGAQADVENARAGIATAKQQFDAAKAQLLQAQANNVKAQSDLVRYKALVDKQEVSEQQYDQAVAVAHADAAAVDAAQASASAAEHQVTQAQSRSGLIPSGAALGANRAPASDCHSRPG